ncbi:caspase 1, apoptosis-related cysteine peptidase, partial [Chelydra serpentina]
MADRMLSDVRIRFVESVSRAVISTLLDDLLERRVLNEEEVEEVKESCSKKSDQARCLIDGVRKRGPEPAKYSSSASASEMSTWPRSWGSEPPRIYPIRDKATRTRLALIICNVEFDHLRRRDGADVDVTGMKRLLEGLGYKVETHCNLNAQAMAETLKQFAARNEHRTSDSTFLVLMSHGVRTGLCGTKSQGESTDVLSVDTIYTTFNNKNCQALVGKPKVIIIQACRG